jgi:acetyl-CoA carboxylase beta subunit
MWLTFVVYIWAMEEMKKKPGVVLHSSGGYRYQKRYPKDVLEAIAHLSTHPQWQDVYSQYANQKFYRHDSHTKDIREANNAHAHVNSKAQVFFDKVRVDYAKIQGTVIPKSTALSQELADELAEEILDREKQRELKRFAKNYDALKRLPEDEQDERLQDILIE